MAAVAANGVVENMEERPPMIVSSNRFNDLEPYCSRIYHQRPEVWESVFPWEFPQHASKEQEEEFLSTCFSKDEIHMQGYRFLKQVFYSIALYNLNVRIPAFTEWWLSKPTSVELLDDPNMHPFLLKSDVTTSTFFEDELPQYGEKFLKWTIPQLQQTIRQRLEKQQSEKKTAPAPMDEVKSSRLILREVSGESEPKSARSGVSIVKTTVSLPSPANFLALSAKDLPHSAPPLMTAAELAPRPRVASKEHQPHQARQSQYEREEQPSQTQPSQHRREQHPPQAEPPQYQPLQHESQIQHRKRGNSFNKPNNHRGRGNFSSRNERNAPIHPGPIYALTPDHMRANPRAVSGGPTDFMNPIPQGHAVPPTSMQHQFHPAMFGHPTQPPHNMPRDPAFAAKYHPPYFNQPFREPQNPHGFPQFDPQMQYFDQPDNFQGGYRRNSQGSRGRPFRGHHGGKNSRGKNSFSSYDQYQNAFQHDGGNFKHFGDGSGHPSTNRQRRGSAIFEKNWRSGSDDPQIRHDGLTKENKPPVQSWNRHTSYAEPPPHSYPRDYRPSAPGIDPAKLEPDQKCGPDWIGERCTYADKLIAMDMPAFPSDDEYQEFFSRFANVKQVNRTRTAYVHPTGPRCNVFITFASAAEARKCLLNKPSKWLDGQPLKLAVSKTFWDETHSLYIFAPGPDPQALMNPPEETKMMEGQVSAILRRTTENAPNQGLLVDSNVETSLMEDTSADATPTPSGASTPKKKRNNKSKKKKDKDDLRKTSLKNDMDLTIETGEPSTGTRTTITPSAVPSEKQRSDSEQTEVRSKSEPTLISPSDTIQTNLPVPNSAHTEVQAASEIGFSPGDEITTKLPDETTPFRAEEKKEATEASTAEVSDLSETTTTPHKSDSDPVDDSFHTATGSTDDLLEKDTLATPIRTATRDVSDTMHRERRGSSDSPVSPKTVKRVHVPQLTTRTRLPSTSSTSTAKPEGLEPPQPTAPAISPALPTPAFFTAPNTPAAPQIPSPKDNLEIEESPKTAMEDAQSATSEAKEPQEETAPQSLDTSKLEQVRSMMQVPDKTETEAVISTPRPPKQPEKAKGPAQTESFSLFGRKKENKKPKAGKKGTLKGKPKMDSAAASEVASDSMSRVVSGASTPNIELPMEAPIEVKKKAETKDDKEDDTKDKKTKQGNGKIDVTTSIDSAKTENVIPASTKTGKRKHRSESKVAQQAAPTSQDTERAMAEDLVGSAVPQLETPSKRKGIGNFFSGLFTGSKSQDKSADEPTSKAESIFGQFKSLAGSGDAAATDNRGSNASNNDVQGAEAAKKKSNKHRGGRKKKKKAADENDEGSQPAPIVEQPAETQSSPAMFRFGDKEAFPFRLSTDGTKKEAEDEDAVSPTTVLPRAPPPPSAVDEQDHETEVVAGLEAISDATSRTDTPHETPPSSDSIQQSTPSGMRVAKRTETSNHLVEAKTPTWKQRKRTTTPRKADTPPESEEGDADDNEDENTNSLTLIVNSPEKTTLRVMTSEEYVELNPDEQGRPQKYFIYVDHGPMDEDGSAHGRVGLSGVRNEEMREIAESEVKRARGRMEGSGRVEEVEDE